MNYMKKITEMLGVEMGEQFKLRLPGGDILRGKYQITKERLADESGFSCSYVLHDILAGRVEIVKLPWRPQDGDKVYFVTPIGYVGNKPFRSLDPLSLFQLKNNLLYKTFADAQANVDKDVAFYNDLREQ